MCGFGVSSVGCKYHAVGISGSYAVMGRTAGAWSWGHGGAVAGQEGMCSPESRITKRIKCKNCRETLASTPAPGTLRSEMALQAGLGNLRRPCLAILESAAML